MGLCLKREVRISVCRITPLVEVWLLAVCTVRDGWYAERASSGHQIGTELLSKEEGSKEEGLSLPMAIVLPATLGLQMEKSACGG